MVHADWLFLLTDVECLYTDNPRTNPQAEPVYHVDNIEHIMSKVTVSSPGSTLGTGIYPQQSSSLPSFITVTTTTITTIGGMVTKMVAARLATAAGVHTVIKSSKTPDEIPLIMRAVKSGATAKTTTATTMTTTTATTKYTHFSPKPNPMVDRKWWIAHGLAARGTLYVEGGAHRALLNDGSASVSLFAAGIVDVEGEFQNQEAVRIVGRSNAAAATSIDELEIGRGLVNYTSQEIHRIKGCQSHQIAELLGYQDSESVIDRDNLVITARGSAVGDGSSSNTGSSSSDSKR